MAGRLEGKVAVVTGGGSGIGEATAEVFVEQGCKVVVVDISGTQDEVAQRLGENAIAVKADVSDETQIKAAIDAAVEKWGRLDVLFNNAGIDGALNLTGDYTGDDWDKVLAVNLKGVMLGTKHAIPHMKKVGGGSVISTASMAARVAFANMPAYCASKAAVVMFSRTAAVEYAPDKIRVNTILPGVIDTGMSRSLPDELIQGIKAATPLGYIADAREIGTVALFLATDDASFITGQDIVVDGGYTLV